MTAWRAVLAAVGATAAIMAGAACSSTPGPASSTPGTPTTSATTAHLTTQQAAPLVVQCFADKHLIPAARLRSGKNASPPNDSSTWLRDGKVTANPRFGDWFSENSDVVVRGKSIGDWVTEIAAGTSAWPISICGPMPG